MEFQLIRRINMDTEIEFVAELKSRFNDLSNFQALHIACEIRRNNILEAALSGEQARSKTAKELLAATLGIDRKSIKKKKE